jgi:predicted nucleic acid-binding Zn ribbon protein
MPERICVRCGKAYIDTIGTRKYCGNFCRNYARLKARRGNMLMKCERCGADYYTHQPESRFCSIPCKDAFHADKVFTAHTCSVCGKSFMRSTKKKIYCSRTCYDAMKAKRDKERRDGN